MAIIKPISDLRNKANEISALVHDSNEPVYITKNGRGDMVLMSMAYFRNLELRLTLYNKLAAAQAQAAAGDKGKPYRKVVQDLRKRIRAKR